MAHLARHVHLLLSSLRWTLVKTALRDMAGTIWCITSVVYARAGAGCHDMIDRYKMQPAWRQGRVGQRG
jgi:hypothetical protein